MSAEERVGGPIPMKTSLCLRATQIFVTPQITCCVLRPPDSPELRVPRSCRVELGSFHPNQSAARAFCVPRHSVNVRARPSPSSSGNARFCLSTGWQMAVLGLGVVRSKSLMENGDSRSGSLKSTGWTCTCFISHAPWSPTQCHSTGELTGTHYTSLIPSLQCHRVGGCF